MRWKEIVMFIVFFATSAWCFRASGLAIWELFEEKRERRTVYVSRMFAAVFYMLAGFISVMVANSFRLGR